MQCPSCHGDLSDRTEGACPHCGYLPNWKRLLAQAYVPPDPSPFFHCPGCGYDLRGTPKGNCPECGQAFERDAILERLQNHSHGVFVGMIVLTIGPIILLLIAMFIPNGEVVGKATILWVLIALATMAVAAAKDARRASFRRVVLMGHRPSATFTSMRALATFLCMLAYAAMTTGIVLLTVQGFVGMSGMG